MMKIRCLLCVMLVLVPMVCGTISAATKVIEWKFEGNLNDTSGNGLNATAFGTPAYNTGVSGQAFVSDGTNSAYKTGIDTSVLPVDSNDLWSVNVWLYPTEIPQDWRVAWCLGHKPDGYKNSRALYSSGYSTGAGLITFVGKQTPDGGATGVTVYTVSSIPWDINQWQMITTTYDGNIVRIYKNGVLIAMRNQTFLDAPGEVRVPTNPWNGYDFFIGKFDEFTVWRGALSIDEILDLVIPGAIPAVELNQQVVYYKMEDATSSVMPDHSGLSNNGELYGYSSPISNWLDEGFRGDALRFAGGQEVIPPVTVSQPANYTISFWLKSGHQSYKTAFYSERKPTDGTQLIIRANNAQIQVFSKERDYNFLFSIAADASAYLDGTTWNHVAVVADGEAALASLYVNGQLLVSGGYEKSTHKSTGMEGSIGYSWADDGDERIGGWGDTYVDEVKFWNGALSPLQIQAIAARSNFGNDLAVNMEDLALMAGEWSLDYQTSPSSIMVADDMEGSIDGWSVHSGSFSGTGMISQTTNAYAGNGALRWEYDLPATVDPNNYTSIVFDFGESKNLSIYDKVSLWLYRHEENTSENLLFFKFYEDGDFSDPNTLKAEAWILSDDCVTEPNEEWAEWVIDPNSLLGPSGFGTADESDLTAIRYLLIGTGSWERADARTGTIDIDEITFEKYPDCSGRPATDVNYDCKVDIADLRVIAEEWLFGTE